MAVIEPIGMDAFLPPAELTLIAEGLRVRVFLFVRFEGDPRAVLRSPSDRPFPVRSAVEATGAPVDAAPAVWVDLGRAGLGVLEDVGPRQIARRALRVVKDLGEVSLRGATPSGGSFSLWGLPLVFVSTDYAWGRIPVGTFLRHRPGVRGL